MSSISHCFINISLSSFELNKTFKVIVIQLQPFSSSLSTATRIPPHVAQKPSRCKTFKNTKISEVELLLPLEHDKLVSAISNLEVKQNI